MCKKIIIFGGDLRNFELAKKLAEDGNEVFIYGMENVKSALEIQVAHDLKIIKNSDELDNIYNSVEIVIGPTPFSRDNKNINAPFTERNIAIEEIFDFSKGKILFAGSIKDEIISKNNQIKIIDIMRQERLTILNTIATAEGTIEVIMKNVDTIIHGSNILVLGFGRTAKIIAQKLKGLSANVTCAARKKEDLAWINSYGYVGVEMQKALGNVNNCLQNYQILVNTVPNKILNFEILNKMNKECLIVDIASNPGGVDKKAAEELGIKVITALGLPGKVAPKTTAQFIKEEIYDLLNIKIKEVTSY